VNRAIESASTAGRSRVDLHRRLPRSERAGDRSGDAPRAVRVSPLHGRGPVSDGADTGRHRKRMGDGARDWEQVDPASIGRIAAQKAVASRNPQNEPGLYTAVLGTVSGHRPCPAPRRRVECALGRKTIRSRSLEEDAGRREGDGRTGDALLGPVGSTVARPAVRFRGSAARPHGLGREGFCATSPTRVSGRRSREAANRAGVCGRDGAGGGTKSTEEVIAGCTRGILVTHFFYIRSLDPRTVLQTGLTRDGTFLIENGRTRALKNFRWNESPLLMLNRLEEIGARPHDGGAPAARSACASSTSRRCPTPCEGDAVGCVRRRGRTRQDLHRLVGAG
jgi:hypothetical protein